MTKTVRPRNLEIGDHVVEGYNDDQKLLIRDFWIESSTDISRLEDLGVHRVTVDDRSTEAPKPPTRQKAPSPEQLEQDLEEASDLSDETQTLYRHTVTKIKDIFFSADRTEDINPEELSPFIDKVLNYARESPGSVAVLTQIEDYDYSTFQHSVNMGILCVLYSRHRDYDEDEMSRLALAGMLHDIGKIRIPEEIILKEGELTEEEFEVVKTHSRKGYNLLKDLGLEEDIARVALEHHERPDASGYPESTDQIHPNSRVVSVLDMYDAMTSKRVYSDEIRPNRAFSIMRNEFGDHPETRSILYDLLRCLGLYPVGSLVQLNSGEFAVVHKNYPEDLKRPEVCVITDDEQEELESPFLLDLKRLKSHKSMKNGQFYDYRTEIDRLLRLDEIPTFEPDRRWDVFGQFGF